MSYRVQDSVEQQRRKQREELQEQLRLLDEEERRAQALYPRLTASTSNSSSNLPSIQHSRHNTYDTSSNNTSNTWRDTSTHPQSDSTTSHTSRPQQTSFYPHSQAWNPQPQPSTSTAQSSSHATSTHSRAPQQLQHTQQQQAPSPTTNGKPAVPSQEQVHDYLRTHMGQQDGIYAGYQISGQPLDVYTLFTGVVRLGGSSRITTQDSWPIVAAHLGFPAESIPASGNPRSSARVGAEVREFFLRLLGGLEILWEKTKGGEQQDQSFLQPPPQASSSRRQEQTSSSPNLVQPKPTSQSPSDNSASNNYLPTPMTGRTFPSGLQVSDLTNSKPKSAKAPKAPKASKKQQASTSTGTNPTYPYTGSSSQRPDSNGNGIRPTPSPVDPNQPYHASTNTVYPSQLASERSNAQNSRPAPTSTQNPRTHGNAAPLTPLTAPPVSAAGQRPLSNQNERPANSPMEYEPSNVSNFDDLVDSGALPLPSYGANTPLPTFTSNSLEYAYRAHELRSSIRKMSSSEQHRSILPEEIIWWNRLVLLLQKNPSVVIPKPAGSAQSAPTPRPPSPGPPLPTTIAPTSIHHLVQQPIIPAIPPPVAAPAESATGAIDANPQPVDPNAAPPKKKRGRKPKSNLPPLEPGTIPHAEVTGDMTGANAAGEPVKKKRGRPPKDRSDENPFAPPKQKRVKKPKVVADAVGGGSSSALNPVLPDATATPTTSTITQALANAAEAATSLAGGLPTKLTQARPGMEDGSSTQAADFLRMVYARQNATSASSASGPTELFPLVHTTDSEGVVPSNATLADVGTSATLAGSSGPSAQAGKPVNEVKRKAAKERWDRHRAQLAAEAAAGGGDGSAFVVPDGEASASAKKKVAKVRMKKSLDGTRPGFTRMPSVVDSASPKRILHLSGRVSNAFLSDRDVKTPTKVVVKSVKPVKPSRLSLSLVPDPSLDTNAVAGPSTLADSTEIIDLVDDDDDDNPFMELSQSFVSAPAPPRDRASPFVEYVAPAARRVEVSVPPPDLDDIPMLGDMDTGVDPEAAEAAEVIERLVQEMKASVAMNNGRGPGKWKGKGKFRKWIPEPTVMVPLEEPEFEIVEEPIVAEPRGKGKAKDKGKGKAVQEIVEVVLPIRPSPTKPSPAKSTPAKGKTLTPISYGSTRSQPSPPPIVTPSEPVHKPAGPRKSLPSHHGPSALRHELKRLELSPPPSSQSARGSKGTQRTLHTTRSRGGPPSTALRARPEAIAPTKPNVANKKSHNISRPAPIRSPSVVFIPSVKAKPQPKAYAKPPAKAQQKSKAVPASKSTRPITKRKVQTKEDLMVTKHRRVATGPMDRVKISIPITAARRKRLVLRGLYDPFRDDDSDEEDLTRHAHIPLRPSKPVPAKSRALRPSEPDVIPLRFLHRAGPALFEPFKSVLNEHTLLKRSTNSPCEWKGCGAILASETLLQKHVDFRKHTSQASFRTGPHSQQLWRCHWRDCEGSCFVTEAGLSQHITARHVSRNLACPYGDCELFSPNVSHLSRHVTKQHEHDDPRPLADLSDHIEPPAPTQALPEHARTDELTTQAIIGTVYASRFRRDWAVTRVADNCFGGENPVMHVEHAPHMLEVGAAGNGAGDDDERFVDEDELYDAEEREMADRVRSKRSNWEAVVFIPPYRVPKASLNKKTVGQEAEVIVIDDDEAALRDEAAVTQDSALPVASTEEIGPESAQTAARGNSVDGIDIESTAAAKLIEAGLSLTIIDREASIEEANEVDAGRDIRSEQTDEPAHANEAPAEDTLSTEKATEEVTSLRNPDEIDVDEAMDEDEVLALTVEDPKLPVDGHEPSEGAATLVKQDVQEETDVPEPLVEQNSVEENPEEVILDITTQSTQEEKQADSLDLAAEAQPIVEESGPVIEQLLVSETVSTPSAANNLDIDMDSELTSRQAGDNIADPDISQEDTTELVDPDVEQKTGAATGSGEVETSAEVLDDHVVEPTGEIVVPEVADLVEEAVQAEVPAEGTLDYIALDVPAPNAKDTALFDDDVQSGISAAEPVSVKNGAAVEDLQMDEDLLESTNEAADAIPLEQPSQLADPSAGQSVIEAIVAKEVVISKEAVVAEGVTGSALAAGVDPTSNAAAVLAQEDITVTDMPVEETDDAMDMAQASGVLDANADFLADFEREIDEAMDQD